jgi:hypothetical protein
LTLIALAAPVRGAIGIMANGYGSMQLADYLVSFALHSLNRCLLKVGGDAPLTAKEQRLLQEQISHLQSLWQMMQWSVGKSVQAEASARLREAAAMLAGAAPELAAGLQLKELADDKLRAVLDRLVARYAVSAGATVLRPEQCDRLSTLLQEESACWRDYAGLRQISEPALVEHGMGRAYDKGRRLMQRLDAATAAGKSAPGPKRLARTYRWVGHTANHLDVLRPGLDDAGRAQRWHLRRLHGKLEQQLGLELLARRAVKEPMRPKVLARLGRLVSRQRQHLEKQRSKLSNGAYGPPPAEFERQALTAVKQLGLGEITLLALPAENSA